MGCNCKNNSGTLAWVVGNDVLLKLWLWEKTATKEYKQTTLPFPLEEATELVVVARADYGKEYSLSFSLSEDSENCLLVEIPSTLGVGTYSLCVKCVLRGRDACSLEEFTFQIVRSNKDANITFERIGDARQAEYSMEFQMVPSAVARGANAYELWLEQGHEGTIDDFLDYYIATLATEQEDGLMSHEDKKKLDDLPSAAELDSQLENLEDAVEAEERRAEQAEQTLGGAISTEAAAREAADTTLSGAINSEAAAREAADNALGGRATALEGRVSDIEGKIPQQASEQNQLADKDFVNSSISTATAEFKGTYNSLAELEQVEANMNDYAFVVGQDAAGNTVYSRYKYVGQTRGSSWAFEFNLNNSSFTAAQWAAINSAITSGDVEKLAVLPTKQQLDLLFSGKQDVISDLATIRSGAALGATAVQTETDPTVPLWAKQSTKPSYTPQEVGALPANTPLFDGDYNSLTNKPDLSGFITISVNNLVNYYLKSETYTKQEVQGLIAAIQQFHYEIYASTSDVTNPQGNVLYLIGPTGTGTDKYEEYVYDSTKQEPWVKIGDTSIDLSDYYTKGQADSAITQALNTALADYTTTAALTLLLAGKQDALVSGTNIKTLNGESILGSGNMDIIGCYTPTLSNAPTSSTTAYIKDGKTINFEIGQFCRVPNINETYTFYQLYDLVTDGNTTAAVWQEVLVDEDFSLAITVLGANDIPQFDPDEPYSVGAFVMNNGFLYKFTSPHTSGEPWNPQEVQKTNLVTEVDNMVKSDYEEVIIDLKTETDDPLPNVEVVVTVEGEQSGRNLTTDAQGRCTTNVQKGLEYTVSCANVPNYLPVTDIVRRASLPTRYITVTYVEDDTLTRETVKITVGYSDQTLPKATWVRISYGGENYQLSLNDQNIAETTVRLGTVYTVSFEDIDGYKTPSPQTYTASLHGTRNINVSYVAPVAGLKWLMSNNTERELNDVSDLERINGDIFGLIVQTSDLMAAGCSFVIPLPFLLTQSATGTGQWLSANVTVPQLNYFGSLQAALADFDGDANCAGIEQFIAEAAQQGTTYTSSMVSNCRGRVGGAPSFDDTKNYEAGDYVVYRNYLHLFLVDHAAGPWVDGETERMTGFLMPDGVVRKCFSPAFAQIYAFRLLRDKVNEFTTSVFGIGSCNIASGHWWCSTQYNASNGVSLSNGAFNDYTKTHDYTLLPVLAY